MIEEGERLGGLATGIDRRHLRRLRRGQVPVDARIDLHGLDARAARAALRDTLAEVWQSGERCVLVVHGRGLHSGERAVLKGELVRWLGQSPWGGRVMAFASARPEHGGTGATYVLLRRERGPA